MRPSSGSGSTKCLTVFDYFHVHVPNLFYFYFISIGKPANEFAFDGEPQGRDFALNIVEECHQQWVKLMEGDSDEGMSRLCTEFEASTKIDASEAEEIISETAEICEPGEVDSIVDKWHYVNA